MNVQTRYGTMSVLPNDLIASRSLQQYGEWAQAELDVLTGLLDPGMTVIDGGAYLGSHTLAFARCVGPSGRVHACEANPGFFPILQGNVAANALGNVTCHNIGLADAIYDAFVGPADLDRPSNFGGTSLLHAPQQEPVGTVDVRVHFTTLDRLLGDKVDLIKLDIEGMEELALRGAGSLLDRWRPIVFAECNDLASGVPLLQLMRTHGYAAFGCLTAAFNARNFNRATANMFGDAKELGLLLVHRDALPPLAARIASLGLPAVDSFDDVALLLCHKPQYPTEVLAQQSVGRMLGLDYPSPRSRALEGATAAALAEAQSLAHGRAREIDDLSARLAATDAALTETQSLAHGRAREIGDLSARLAATDAALAEAQSLAHARADEVSDLSARLSATDAALAGAQSLAHARADDIFGLSARFSATDAALASAQALAISRAGEVEELDGRLSQTDAALAQAQSLAIARAGEIDALSARLAAIGSVAAQAQQMALDRGREVDDLARQLREAMALAEATHAALMRATRWWWRYVPAAIRPPLPRLPLPGAAPDGGAAFGQAMRSDIDRIARERDQALLRLDELNQNLDRWRAALRPFPEYTDDIPEWTLPRGAHLAAAPQRYSENYAAYVRRGGKFEPEDLRGFLKGNSYFIFDQTRFYFFNLALDQIAKEDLPGDFAELGVDKGNSASILALAAQRLGKTIYLLDTFEGFSPADLVGGDAVHGVAFTDTSLDLVRGQIDGGHVRFIKGYFPDSAAQLADGLCFSLVHLDCDLYKPFASALDYFWPRLVPGGFLIMHDYTTLHWDGVEKAVDDFFAERGEAVVPIPDMAGTAVVRKSKLPGPARTPLHAGAAAPVAR